ncbi:MAG TPA: AarF/UbiB family protein [Longimicrobium sp.]|nr:AarF/UbiB family protein [Longimicrobium sp.]
MRSKEVPIPTAPADGEGESGPRARRPRAEPPAAEPQPELFGSEPRPDPSPVDAGPRLSAFPQSAADGEAAADEATAEDAPILRFVAGGGERTIEAPDPIDRAPTASAPSAEPDAPPIEATAEAPEPPLAELFDPSLHKRHASTASAPPADADGPPIEATVEAYEPPLAEFIDPPPRKRRSRAKVEEVERTVEAFAVPPRTPDPDATLLEPRALVPVRETPAASPSDPPSAASSDPAPEPRPAAAPPPPSADTTPPPAPSRPFLFDPLRPYRGVVRRFFVVYRHVLGLLAGGAAAYVRALPRERRHGLHSWFPRLTASLVWPFLDKEIRKLTFPQQLRRRLEILGPTYIKLGQIMAIREDLLPRSITRELQNLFDRLPAIPFIQLREIIERGLERPLEASFRSVSETPLGSASIAQAHLAETLEGERVVVKVIKPGVAEMIESDLTLLGMVGGFLQWLIPRYQPRQIAAEFSAYTRKEVDYTFEADNAETFAANFRDIPDVVFPRIHRHLSSREVLTMEFMDGFKPGSPATFELPAEDRARVVDLGAASIIRMLYRDGFFHADLHAGNLMILPGKRVRVAFIDLGMVGRFEERTRRQMLYYFHALVTGDVEGSTRYLVDMATVGKGGDPAGFRRAVTDLSRRFVTHAARGEISIAQLILESVGLGGRYRVFFPVEMTLMVKALVTFEGVGRVLDPQLDVAGVSQKHVSKIFQQQFDPRQLARQLLRGSPEMVDLAIRLPQLLSAGFKFADEHLNSPPQNPLSGIKGSILAAACIIGGVLAAIQQASPLLWGGMFVLAIVLSLFGK